MKRETTVILAALGAIPAQAMAENGTAEVQQVFALNPRTVSVVQGLIQKEALYANADATELRIRSDVLDNEVLAAIEQSGRAQVDEQSGDFVVSQSFASALAKSRVLHQGMPKTVEDYLLLLKLEGDQESDLRVERASFRSTPFF